MEPNEVARRLDAVDIAIAQNHSEIADLLRAAGASQ